MIDENLAYKFDDLADLPISEEMLGAYLEGNLHGSDAADVMLAICSSSDIRGVVNGVTDIDDRIFDMGYDVVDFVPVDESWTDRDIYDDVAACVPDDVSEDFVIIGSTEVDEDDIYDDLDSDDFSQTADIDTDDYE